MCTFRMTPTCFGYDLFTYCMIIYHYYVINIYCKYVHIKLYIGKLGYFKN